MSEKKPIKPGSIVRGIDRNRAPWTNSDTIETWDKETGMVLVVPTGTVGFVTEIIIDKYGEQYDVCWPTLTGKGETTRVHRKTLKVLWTSTENRCFSEINNANAQ